MSSKCAVTLKDKSGIIEGVTFEDEFRKFLRRYEVEFDKPYLWD